MKRNKQESKQRTHSIDNAHKAVTAQNFF